MKNLFRTLTHYLLYLAILLPSTGCWYSFTGVSIPSDMKSLKIENFTNTAELVVPNFTQILSQKLRDTFLAQSNLKQVDTDQADLLIKGNIVSYTITPIALQGNDNAAQNRLTVAIEFSIFSQKFEEFNQNYTLSNFVDFSQNYNTIENQLLNEISTKLTQDIFNKTFSNW